MVPPLKHFGAALALAICGCLGTSREGSAPLPTIRIARTAFRKTNLAVPPHAHPDVRFSAGRWYVHFVSPFESPDPNRPGSPAATIDDAMGKARIGLGA